MIPETTSRKTHSSARTFRSGISPCQKGRQGLQDLGPLQGAGRALHSGRPGVPRRDAQGRRFLVSFLGRIGHRTVLELFDFAYCGSLDLGKRFQMDNGLGNGDRRRYVMYEVGWVCQ